MLRNKINKKEASLLILELDELHKKSLPYLNKINLKLRLSDKEEIEYTKIRNQIREKIGVAPSDALNITTMVRLVIKVMERIL